MTLPSTRFVFSIGLYPKTPFEGNMVWVHGIVEDIRNKVGETIFHVKDEKGKWSAYGDAVETIKIGDRVRAYGMIVNQPDGNMLLAAKWVKKIEKEEYAFCEKQTHAAWENILKQYHEIIQLVPFVPPISRKNNIEKTPLANTPEKKEREENDFIPATELKVEQDYL
ncbi:MAG: OB-fold nucleic acid binding domain-containing protein [Candidatus Diapherotrites archaeon]